MLEMEDSAKDPIAIHVLVVGFHHKKGMQVEYAYPPLQQGGNDCELPDKWKHLPSLCLPDGAHNHEADTIYFHLPHLVKEDQTVFGVSCYRQIDAQKVTNKTADITRNTVQKSVCVLTTLPIYGYVQERLRVTTKVYFSGADFSDVQDLEGLYHDLNTTNWKDKLLHGICVSDIVRIFGRNILVLFKLLLLERRVLFYHSPVGPMVKAITSLLALLPSNLPDGLTLAAATSNEADPNNEIESPQNAENGNGKISSSPKEIDGTDASSVMDEVSADEESSELAKIINVTDDTLDLVVKSLTGDRGSFHDDGSDRRSSNSSLTSVTSRGSIMSPPPADPTSGAASATTLTTKITSLKGRLSGAFNYWTGREKAPGMASATSQDRPSITATPNPSPSEPGDEAPLSPTSGTPLIPPVGEEPKEFNFQTSSEKFALIEPQQCGLPLQIFAKGNLVHPYLSLQYLDLLNEPTTRAFVVGASNTLFLHKRNLYDALVQLEDGKIEVTDPDLRRQLSLSTEDLRFAENILRQVEAVNASISKSTVDDALSTLSQPTETQQPDVFLEGVGWVGGEEWLRHQFKIYLVSLLRSSLCPDNSKIHDYFNSSFISAWKGTHNYRMWSASGPHPDLMDLLPGHSHAGNLSMTDMRIRLSHTIRGLDRNKRINQTLASTGTAVVKTKEAVGGAITSARGALTNLWSSFTHPSVVTTEEDFKSPETELASGVRVEEASEATEDPIDVEQNPLLLQGDYDSSLEDDSLPSATTEFQNGKLELTTVP